MCANFFSIPFVHLSLLLSGKRVQYVQRYQSFMWWPPQFYNGTSNLTIHMSAFGTDFIHILLSHRILCGFSLSCTCFCCCNLVFCFTVFTLNGLHHDNSDDENTHLIRFLVLIIFVTCLEFTDGSSAHKVIPLMRNPECV